MAVVTAERRNPCHGRGCWFSEPYQIKYQFNVASDASVVYGYTGSMLFSEPWVRVPKSVWAPAATTKQTSVLYAPQNPRINQPTGLATPSALDAFGFAVISVLMAVVGGFYWRGYKV
jgi:hypothetical protein